MLEKEESRERGREQMGRENDLRTGELFFSFVMSGMLREGPGNCLPFTTRLGFHILCCFFLSGCTHSQEAPRPGYAASVATLDPLTHCTRLGLKPETLQ